MLNKYLYYELFYFIYVIVTIGLYPILILIAIVNKIVKVLKNLFATKNVRGQVAVITGSGRGLGREIATILASKGCHIAIVDVQEKLALETAQYLGKTFDVKVKAYKVDIRDFEQLLKLRDSVTSELGVPTILINNAGIVIGSAIKDPSPQGIKQMIDVNFTAMCYTHQIFLPKMKELNRGYIVNICSLCALFNFPLADIYSATKAAVRSLTSSLRMECWLEGKNITATTVMPTFLSTNKRYEETYHLAGVKYLFPLMDGEIVAKYVVDGMLSGSREVSVPTALLYIYKLLEILPIIVKEQISSCIAFFTYKNVLNSKEISKVLEKGDLSD